MNVEPKLTRHVPPTWVGGVTLTGPEVEEAVRLLPEGPLRSRLEQMHHQAVEQASELNRLDRNGIEALSRLVRRARS